MLVFKQKNTLVLAALSFIATLVGCSAVSEASLSNISQAAHAKGFVYLHDVDPTIITSVRYNSNENFIGRPIQGYKKSVIMMTKQAAEALKKVQAELKKDGYSLVIYDAYRPQQAVDNFMRWSEDSNDQVRKYQYYPRINKADVFDLGYIARRSGHTRGSTVDLTIIKDGQKLHDIIEKKRTLLDGYTITLLDDGTVDMGSSFDMLDAVSHYENDLIAPEFKALRTYLKDVMERNGFKNYAEEWWHFTLKNEPYLADNDDSYHNFPIE